MNAEAFKEKRYNKHINMSKSEYENKMKKNKRYGVKKEYLTRGQLKKLQSMEITDEEQIHKIQHI